MSSRIRLTGALVYFALVIIFFGRDLYTLALHAWNNALHSHILLIPFISSYLIYVEWSSLPRDRRSSFFPALLLIGAGSGTAIIANRVRVSENDFLSLIALSVILLVIAAGFLFFGWPWIKACLFPVGFLFFAIPMPDGMADVLETWSKLGSAEVTSWLFALSGVPVIRDSVYFQLPGITIEVAQECSGIRSSWVLLITSMLASYLFLRGGWRRSLLVLLVVPLGLLRNGLRIAVIGLLCVYVSPEMINSFIHHRGGPIFFVLSLIPLFLILWWFRKSERVSLKY